MDNNKTVYSELKQEVVVTWFVGISLSIAFIIAQLLLFCLKPNIRKIDQKILIQLSIARLMNTIVEYLSADPRHIGNKTIVKTLVTTLYVQSDTVLICWMFIYTKNLYDKVVQVFFLDKWNSVHLSLAIWLGSVPVGMLYPLFINSTKGEQYLKVYTVIKFIVLSVNLFFFSKIFYVIAIKHSNSNVRRLIKTCVVSFLLVCITSLQVLLTDLFSFYSRGSVAAITFCVINSYQVLAISIIFFILSRNSSNS